MRVDLVSEREPQSATSCYWKDETTNPVFSLPEGSGDPSAWIFWNCQQSFK